MIAGARIRADRLRATESLYGPTRADRPVDTGCSRIACPFCPGNEHLTAPLLTPDPGPNWPSRVVENLYPAVVEPDGRHEVIIEVRAHDAHWSTLGAGEIERILALYREREAQALADGHAYVAVFKNSGAAAGASLHHPHSQVVALRRIPLSVEARIGRLIAPCDVCGAAADASERRVADFGEIVSFVPDGSRSGFEMRIAPRAHMARFSDWTADLWPVAAAVADAVERLGATLGEQVPFNVIVQSAARDRRAEAYGHWEIEIIPRIENVGGYELGTGGFLVSRLPEEAARILRAVRLARDA